MGHSALCRLVIAILLSIVAHAGQAQPLNLALRSAYAKYDAITALQSVAGFQTYGDTAPWTKEFQSSSFRGRNLGQNLADVWCKTVTRMVYNNSRHPGYGDRVNQDNDGAGFKCRFNDNDPIFVTAAGLTNSQKGVTFAVSFGKQLDVVEASISRFHVKGYVGASLTTMSYSVPHKNKEYFLPLIPMAHRGVSISSPGLCTVGWEEELLPVDKIRLRSWNLRCEKRINLF